MPKSSKRKPVLQLVPRDPLLSPRRSSKKDDPSKVVKAFLRKLPKFKLPAASGKKKSRR